MHDGREEERAQRRRPFFPEAPPPSFPPSNFSLNSIMYRVGQKSVSNSLRDLATATAGGITQPRTNFFGQLCSYNETNYRKAC